MSASIILKVKLCYTDSFKLIYETSSICTMANRNKVKSNFRKWMSNNYCRKRTLKINTCVLEKKSHKSKNQILVTCFFNNVKEENYYKWITPDYLINLFVSLSLHSYLNLQSFDSVYSFMVSSENKEPYQMEVLLYENLYLWINTKCMIKSQSKKI